MSAKWPFRNNKRHAKNKKILIYQPDNSFSSRSPNSRSDARHRKLRKFLRRHGNKLRNAHQVRDSSHCEQLTHKLIHRMLRKKLRKTLPLVRPHPLFGRQKKPRTSLGEGEVRGPNPDR